MIQLQCLQEQPCAANGLQSSPCISAVGHMPEQTLCYPYPLLGVFGHTLLGQCFDVRSMAWVR